MKRMMKKVAMLLMPAMLLGGSLSVKAAPDVQQSSAADTFVYGDTTLPYRLVFPENHDENKTYPLILFLHGSGERGKDNVTQLRNSVQQVANYASDALILVPQCPPEGTWVNTVWEEGSYSTEEIPETNEMAAAIALVSEIQKNYPVDVNRTYIAGISMGGFGVWDAVVRHPEMFAAGVAVCGSGDPSQAAKIVDIPMFVFHGEADPVVPVAGSRDMVEAIQAAGGEKVTYIEYPGAQHNIWNTAYDTPELYEELLAISRDGGEATEKKVDSADVEEKKQDDVKSDDSNMNTYIIIAAVAAVAIAVITLVVVALKKKK